MTKYLNAAFLLVAAAIGIFGWILPYLISAANTELMLAGFVLIAGIIYTVARLVLGAFTKKKEPTE